MENSVQVDEFSHLPQDVAIRPGLIAFRGSQLFQMVPSSKSWAWSLTTLLWCLTVVPELVNAKTNISLDDVPAVNGSTINGYMKARSEYIGAEHSLRQGSNIPRER